MTSTLFPKSELDTAGKLQFSSEGDLVAGLAAGVFYVKIPAHISPVPGKRFALNFFQRQDGDLEADKYKGFSELSYDDSILGYSDRPDQVEQVQLERSLWDKYFPADLSSMLNCMNAVGVKIVQSIFDYYGISPVNEKQITGGMHEGTGLQYCIFNHYRSQKREVGITSHKDSGFVTVLFMEESGLEAKINDQWVPIEPLPGYFTINLGHAFEVLTRKLANPVTAVDHQVRETSAKRNEKENRFSFGTYVGPRFDMDLYHATDSGELEFFKTFLDFQKQKAREMGYEFHPKVKVTRD